MRERDALLLFSFLLKSRPKFILCIYMITVYCIYKERVLGGGGEDPQREVATSTVESSVCVNL